MVSKSLAARLVFAYTVQGSLLSGYLIVYYSNCLAVHLLSTAVWLCTCMAYAHSVSIILKCFLVSIYIIISANTIHSSPAVYIVFVHAVYDSPAA